jgi:TolA-binding protein
VTCPAQPRIAAAAAGEDRAVIDHARDCLACRALLRDQLLVIDAARMLARPRLRSQRRAELAAEVMAQSDVEAHPPWRGERVMAIAASAVAAAAVVTIVLASGIESSDVPSAPQVASIEEPGTRSVARAQIEPVAAAQRASLVARGADYARMQRGNQDVVTLRDGELSVDATASEPVMIVAGDTRVVIASSRAKVVARGGVIVTTHVFAGTAQVTTTGGRMQVIDAGDVWMRQPDPTPAAEAIPATDSLSAFRLGWEQLRAHNHAQAIAAFDRATDPVVAEDAAFWAAIATERAGDLDGAADRLRSFLDRYSTSPRAEAARAALERVTK